jgi:hypothetical protein
VKEIGSETELDILHINVVMNYGIWGQLWYAGNGI